MGKVQSAVTAVLAGGHLVVPQGNAAITIVSGAMDLNHLTLQAQGDAQLAFNGAIDLGRAAVDARMTLSEAAPPGALIAMRPELSVNLKGPLSAPQRTLDLSALTSWLSLSAAELQTRQIEMIEAAQRAGTAGQDVHPQPPDVRVVSPGTGVESALPSDLLSAPTRIERLQPQPAPPSTGGTQTETAPAVGAPIVIRPSAPPPVPRARPSASTAGTAEQNGRRSVPQEAEPSLPRAD
jgi:hypothetical protein